MKRFLAVGVFVLLAIIAYVITRSVPALSTAGHNQTFVVNSPIPAPNAMEADSALASGAPSTDGSDHSIKSLGTTGRIVRGGINSTSFRAQKIANHPSASRIDAALLKTSEDRIYRNFVETVIKNYARFFAQVGMKDAAIQADVIEVLTDELQLIREITQSQGAEAKPTSASFAEVNRGTEQRLAAFLSPENYAALVEYRKLLPYFPLAEETAARSATQGTPLAASTTNQLAKLLQQVVLPVYTTTEFVTLERYTAVTQRDGEAIAAAKKLLTPQQLEVFKRTLAERIKVK